MGVKIPVSLAFSKLVLDAKVKFLLISWHLSNQYFRQQKKINLYPKDTFILIATSPIKHQHMIIGLFALNSSHQQFIRSKEEINFLRFTDGSFHKNSKIQSSKVYQATKWISIKTKRNIFVLVTSSDNKHQRNYRFLDSFLHKIY